MIGKNVLSICALGGGLGLPAACSSKVARDVNSDALIRQMRQSEVQLGARIGVSVLDTQTGQHWRYRADGRFPLTSTFRALTLRKPWETGAGGSQSCGAETITQF